MTCDDLQLTFPDGAADMVAQAHLETCADCREALEVLTLAAQPAPSAVERAKLVGLPTAVQTEWLKAQRRHSRARSFVGLAIAASLGAVAASGLMWKLNPKSAAVAVHPDAATDSGLMVWMEDSTPLAADDESNFEVSWPSLNEEGDVL